MSAHRIRVKVFVDFWNFQLSVKSLDSQFNVDWQKLGQAVAKEAVKMVDPSAPVTYQGMNVYGSFDPDREQDKRFVQWALYRVSTFAGLDFTLIPRQRTKKRPACPSCYKEVLRCPQCNADIQGTEEKGVDTRIVTDMIKLVAALLS